MQIHEQYYSSLHKCPASVPNFKRNDKEHGTELVTVLPWGER